jgi:putative transposase
MQRIMTGYAVNFNKRYKRKGHLFQNRYKSIIVEEDAYFLELVRYIHLNPLRAGILQNIGDLKTYPFTGHSVVLGECRFPDQNVDTVLAQFSQKKSTAVKAYLEFVVAGVGQGTRKDLQGGGLIRSAGGIAALLARGSDEHEAADERILGSGDFVDLVLHTHNEAIRATLARVDDVLSDICAESGFNREQILGPSRNRDVSKARRVFYMRAQEAGTSLAHLARITGRSHVSVGRAIQQVKQ